MFAVMNGFIIATILSSASSRHRYKERMDMIMVRSSSLLPFGIGLMCSSFLPRILSLPLVGSCLPLPLLMHALSLTAQLHNGNACHQLSAQFTWNRAYTVLSLPACITSGAIMRVYPRSSHRSQPRLTSQSFTSDRQSRQVSYM